MQAGKDTRMGSQGQCKGRALAVGGCEPGLFTPWLPIKKSAYFPV